MWIRDPMCCYRTATQASSLGASSLALPAGFGYRSSSAPNLSCQAVPPLPKLSFLLFSAAGLVAEPPAHQERPAVTVEDTVEEINPFFPMPKSIYSVELRC